MRRFTRLTLVILGALAIAPTLGACGGGNDYIQIKGPDLETERFTTNVKGHGYTGAKNLTFANNDQTNSAAFQLTGCKQLVFVLEHKRQGATKPTTFGLTRIYNIASTPSATQGTFQLAPDGTVTGGTPVTLPKGAPGDNPFLTAVGKYAFDNYKVLGCRVVIDFSGGTPSAS